MLGILLGSSTAIILMNPTPIQTNQRGPESMLIGESCGVRPRMAIGRGECEIRSHPLVFNELAGRCVCSPTRAISASNSTRDSPLEIAIS